MPGVVSSYGREPFRLCHATRHSLSDRVAHVATGRIARSSVALWHRDGRCAAYAASRPPAQGGGLCPGLQHQNRKHPDSQAERVSAFCAAKGWQVAKVVAEWGAGINEQRPRCLALLADTSISQIVVAHQDRCSRFGVASIQTLLKTPGRELVIVNEADAEQADLMHNVVALITSFCARLYDRRRASRKTTPLLAAGPGGELMRVTRAVTHIHLCDANHAKMAALAALAAEYLRLCQAYTTSFCTEAAPNGYLAPRFESPLSQRWQRVAIQHAAGIAQSWRSNYANAVQDYLDALAAYEEDHEPDEAPPAWRDWNTPVLTEPVMQANANVALLQPAAESTYDYWLRLSTLEKGQPVLLPVKLAAYHRQALAGKTLNTSTVLARTQSGWLVADALL
jgi:hypothetical protein